MLNPNFDWREFAFLSGALGPGAVFVDVGANVGAYSLFLLAAHPELSRVVAIEPNPVSVTRLRDNCAASGATRVTIAPVAAGESDGELSFHHDTINLGASRLSEAGETKVVVRRLADILSDASVTRCDAMKVDVEGFEDQVLLPYLESVPADLWPTRFVVEVSGGKQRSSVGHLLDRGYDPVGRHGHNVLLAKLHR